MSPGFRHGEFRSSARWAEHGGGLAERQAALVAAHALFVYSSVMSERAPERIVIDAGLKAFAVDSGMPVPWQMPGALYHRPSDEHGVIDASACSVRPRRGDKVLLVPGHCDPTVNLHDWYVGVRNGKVEVVWPVSARGKAY